MSSAEEDDEPFEAAAEEGAEEHGEEPVEGVPMDAAANPRAVRFSPSSPLRKSADAKPDHRPPLWSVDKYGSAHGNWDLVAQPIAPSLRTVEELELHIKSSVLSTKTRFDVGPTVLNAMLGLGDHGNSSVPRRPTGRISVEKFQYVLRTVLRKKVKDKLKAAKLKRGLKADDPLVILAGLDRSYDRRQLKYFLVLAEDEVRMIFRKYGHDSKERMPYEVFVQRLFQGASQALAQGKHRDRPFLANKPEEWKHIGNGMIQYRICRRGVFAPTDWPQTHQSVCARSAQKPEAYLKLEHVFGYSGLNNTAPNLFYTSEGDVVYYTAAVGIVYNDETNHQKFFLRHDDDINCLAIHPDDRDTVATGQVGAEPSVWIWSASTLKGPQGLKGRARGEKLEPVKIKLPYGERGVQCLAFSRTGNKENTGDTLVTVSTDNLHTVRVWKWKELDAAGNVKLIAAAASSQGVPPQVMSVCWQPQQSYFSDTGRERGLSLGQKTAHFADFITTGVNHIKFWVLDPQGPAIDQRLTPYVGNFTQIEPPLTVTQQDVLHACYLPTGFVAAGGTNGSITLYNGTQAVKEITAHSSFCRTLCVRSMPDGQPDILLSGGGDGRVCNWNIEEPVDLEGLAEPLELEPEPEPAEDNEAAPEAAAPAKGGRSARQAWEKDWVAANPRKNVEDMHVAWAVHAAATSAGDLTLANALEPAVVASEEPPAYTAIDCDPNDDRKFIAGSKQNDIWEIDESPRVLVEGQSSDVYGLSACRNPVKAGIYASGCEDGSVYLWDATEKKSIKQFEIRRQTVQRPAGCEPGDLLKVKAVAFSEFNKERGFGLFALSTAGVVLAPLTPEEIEQGIVIPDHPDLGGGLQVFQCDGDFCEPAVPESFDSEHFVAQHIIWERKDSNEVIDDIKFSPDGQFLAAASHDNYIYIYKIDWEAKEGRGGQPKGMSRPGQPPSIKLHTKCVGHSSYVTHIDWSVDGTTLCSNSGDYDLLYWVLNADRSAFELKPANVRDMNWDSWTGVLGFDAMGIWQDGMDGTDYNALHRSHGAGDESTGSYCVGSTDDGLVRLFNYPVVVEKAPHHAFRGHSSHVQNVRFLADDTRVVSAGGRDGSMMQWTTHGIAKPSKNAALMKTVKDSKKKLAPKRGSPIRRRGADEADAAAAGPRQVSMEELQKEEALNRAMLKQKDKEINKLKARLGKQSKALRE